MLDGGEHCRQIFGPRHIRPDWEGALSVRPDLAGDVLRRVAGVEPVDRDIGASSGELHGHGAANPLLRASDENDPACAFPACRAAERACNPIVRGPVAIAIELCIPAFPAHGCSLWPS